MAVLKNPHEKKYLAPPRNHVLYHPFPFCVGYFWILPLALIWLFTASRKKARASFHLAHPKEKAATLSVDTEPNSKTHQ